MGCKVNWDVALLNTMPSLRSAQTPDDIRTALTNLLDLAGEIPGPGYPQRTFTDKERMLHDLSWIEDEFYTGSLGERLRDLRDHARSRPHCLVDLEAGTGKPVFDHDDRYYDTEDPYPPEELRILAFCRFWNAIEYYYPYRDILDRN